MRTKHLLSFMLAASAAYSGLLQPALCRLVEQSTRLPCFRLQLLPIRCSKSILDANPARTGGFAGSFYTDYESAGQCCRAFVYQHNKTYILPRSPYRPDPDNTYTMDRAVDVDRNGRIAGTSQVNESGAYSFEYSQAWVYAHGVYRFLPGGEPDSSADYFDSAGNVHGHIYDSESIPAVDASRCYADPDGVECVWTNFYRNPILVSHRRASSGSNRNDEALSQVTLPSDWQYSCVNDKLKWEVIEPAQNYADDFWLATVRGKVRLTTLMMDKPLVKITEIDAISNEGEILGQGISRSGHPVVLVLKPVR